MGQETSERVRPAKRLSAILIALLVAWWPGVASLSGAAVDRQVTLQFSLSDKTIVEAGHIAPGDVARLATSVRRDSETDWQPAKSITRNHPISSSSQ